MAVDEDGNLLVVFSDGVNTYLTTSQDSGAEWSHVVRANNGASTRTAMQPWVVAGDPRRVVERLREKKREGMLVFDAPLLPSARKPDIRDLSLLEQSGAGTEWSLVLGGLSRRIIPAWFSSGFYPRSNQRGTVGR
jgi:hypothetical protein